MTTWNIVAICLGLGLVIGSIVALNIYKKRQFEKFFNQVLDLSKQVPKQKKTSFLLLMFKESLVASKKKPKAAQATNHLNNPKYLEIQMIQMANILKDSSNVKDKTMKNALGMLKDFQAWEKKKLAKDEQKPQNKAS